MGGADRRRARPGGAGAVEGLLARGASRADVGQPADAAWTVLRDPEGNEFCLLEPS